MLPRGRPPKGSLPADPRQGAEPTPSGSAPEPAPESRSRRPRLLRPLLLLAAGLLVSLASVLLYRAIQPPPRPLTQRELAAAVEKALKERRPEPTVAARAYQAIRPSLVLVSARGSSSLGMADAIPGAGVSIGTGVVIEESGAILTSLHVVRDAEQVRVLFSDGFETDAVVAIEQPENDLAVLQPSVVPEGLVPATLAGSGHLRAGDEVVAVGNPFGIHNSVSAGVVSGLGRSFVSPQTGLTMHNLIQFDAAVNPGNSGGPLLDRNGEVVGIVAALLNPVDQEFFVGIGFAVTIETAASALGIPPW